MTTNDMAITKAIKDLYYNKQVRFILMHPNGTIGMYDEKSFFIGELPPKSPARKIIKNVNTEVYLKYVLA